MLAGMGEGLPEGLGERFRVGDALRAGAGIGRLRGPDLVRPFHGVRVRAEPSEDDTRERRIRRLAEAYTPKLGSDQFFSHTTAAVLWGAPVPLRDERIHVSVLGNGSLPRAAGVQGHRVQPGMAMTRTRAGLRVASPATTWAMLGELEVVDLVVLGDYLCRVWRAGRGRRHVGRPSLATLDHLRIALEAGRRPGAARLRAALPRIRTDSWSPRESLTRCIIVDGGLPEPLLNQDIWTDRGEFLACLDLCYPELKIAIEYHGAMHSETYAQDVERLARVRAEGWLVIEVTNALVAHPTTLVARVRDAIRARGGSI